MYQDIEKKALEEFKGEFGIHFKCSRGELQFAEAFLEEHLKEAYEAGKEEERNTPITKEWYDHLFGEACQQAIAEEREKIIKLIDKLNVGEFEYTGYILADYLLEEIQNNVEKFTKHNNKTI